ncbi:MAG: hypothetical protein AAFX81_18750 [Pseudomonadota bacterium]
MARDLSVEPVLDLDEIQGNIIPGFRKDFQLFAFFSIEKADGARAFIRALGPQLDSARAVLAAHAEWKALRGALGREPGAAYGRVFLNLAITGRGLERLGRGADLAAFADDGLRFGLAARSTLIGDPADRSRSGHRSRWLFGSGEREIDLLLILASDNAARLEARFETFAEAGAAQGVALIHVDRGDVAAAPEPHDEQFGFRDGISQPALRGCRSDDPDRALEPDTWPQGEAFSAHRAAFAGPGRQLIWPGQILFGHARQRRDDPLRPDPADTPTGPAFSRNGSLLVYRRLRQRPDRFEAFLARAAAEVEAAVPGSSMNRERIGALLVGRWRSGTPVMRSPAQDIGLSGPAANHFRFATAMDVALPGDDAAPSPGDFNGEICPFAAHIRKVNPRDEPTDLGGAERTVPKLIVRRGITYRAGSSPAADQGLVFVGYQSSIEDQFEFLMRAWVKDPHRPRGGAGHDPILSLEDDGFVRLRLEGRSIDVQFRNDWVVPTGGAYLFAPSISAVRDVLGTAPSFALGYLGKVIAS